MIRSERFSVNFFFCKRNIWIVFCSETEIDEKSTMRIVIDFPPAILLLRITHKLVTIYCFPSAKLLHFSNFPTSWLLWLICFTNVLIYFYDLILSAFDITFTLRKKVSGFSWKNSIKQKSIKYCIVNTNKTSMRKCYPKNVMLGNYSVRSREHFLMKIEQSSYIYYAKPSTFDVK